MFDGVDVALTRIARTRSVEVVASVRGTGKTGYEMEAMVAAAAAALTVYDNAQEPEKGIVVGPIELLSKTGGKSGDWTRPGTAPPRPRRGRCYVLLVSNGSAEASKTAGSRAATGRRARRSHDHLTSHATSGRGANVRGDTAPRSQKRAEGSARSPSVASARRGFSASRASGRSYVAQQMRRAAR